MKAIKIAKNSWFKIGIVAIILILLIIVLSKNNLLNSVQPETKKSITEINQVTSTPKVVPPAKKITELTSPLKDARSRVSKKPFGILISKNNAPVKPEKFSGYHTGVDFEILAGEENQEVPVLAVCTGPLLLKKYATGYGGLVIQQCIIEKETVTIIYGHLKLASIKYSVGDKINKGETLAILGKGYSTETDGERKHLHLGIHKGKDLVLLGYVTKVASLDNWLNALNYLP